LAKPQGQQPSRHEITKSEKRQMSNRQILYIFSL
jgi:hypothetical protein